MSSEYTDWPGTGPDKCIDGNTGGSVCHTNHDRYPWIALDYGENVTVSVEKVVIYNRKSWYGRTRNVEVQISNELPTQKGQSKFTGGQLLGIFPGKALGPFSTIRSNPGWLLKYGRYIIIQMDNGRDPMNLYEVVAFGVSFG